MPLLTIKVKAKRHARWGYAVSAILSLPVSAFWAWVAYSAIGFSPTLALQVFIVFGALSLLFCPLLYLANEKQVRDHSSKALPMTATAFGALFTAAVLYFIARHERDTVLPIVVFAVITIGLGTLHLAIRHQVRI